MDVPHTEQMPSTERHRTLCLLLAGLTGSGKSTFAKRVASKGGIRISVDQLVFDEFGRYGVDYPEPLYPEFERRALETARRQLLDEIGREKRVVLDHGLWTDDDRLEWVRLVSRAGGVPVLVKFEPPIDVLRQRLAARNRETHADALHVTESALQDFIARYEPVPTALNPIDGLEPFELVMQKALLRLRG
ncbi:ATP-binding protein [Cutibacterium equinum]|uniref:ATP-binding protein n=1 Tax=Cutibacterium equinum TaxID=3016342 RepID=A0ABY7R038_9ACTN|nr:ATP-binding protein [Cutibacterium equinum]WCC80661.1 ATP-binding protein [Cutibacterium equinum]